MKHPIQPVELDVYGTPRFKPNAIVSFLLNVAPVNLNDIAVKDFSQNDREQFAQLIGYSLNHFGGLSYVSSDTYETANRMFAKSATETEARIEYLEAILETVRSGMKGIIPVLFDVHPDDLIS